MAYDARVSRAPVGIFRVAILLVLLLVASWAAPAAAQTGVVFSTWLDGNGEGQARDIAYDVQGNLYIAGGTPAPDFPRTVGPGNQGSFDAFVAKLRPDGTLIWARLLGGANYDRAYALEVNAQGVVTIGGRAGPGFPTTPGAYQTQFGGDSSPNALYGPQDGFVARISADGATVLWSTYIGGSDRAFLRDIDIDPSGRVALAYTAAAVAVPFVTPGSFAPQIPAGQFGGVGVLASNGASIVWGGYLGGVGNYAFGTPSVRFAPDGSVIALSHTAALQATTAGAYDRTLAGGSDFHVAKISADGRTLLFGTFLGGSDIDYGDTHNLALAADGTIVIAGTTNSPDFPGTAGRFQPGFGGVGGSFNQTGDGVVARLSADGSQLLAATYLGGSSGEGLEGVAVDASGNVIVSGGTYSSNFPTSADGAQRTNRGSPDAFVAKLSPDLRTLVYGTLWGGSAWDLGLGVAVDAQGALSFVGETKSADFPIVRALRPTLPGPRSSIAVRILPASSSQLGQPGKPYLVP